MFNGMSGAGPAWLRITANAILWAALLLSGCGGSSTSTTSGDVAGLVDIGGGRRLYLECRGDGSPTAVLIAGGFEAGWIWSYALYPTDPVHDEPIDGFSAGRGDPYKLASAVLAAVPEFTRVCTYDRPNTTLGEAIQSERGGEVSTPVAQPHTVEDDVEDLHALLEAAGETGPLVLVAHSYGGLIAALYASRYPDEVVGRVNVDVTNVFLRETLTAADYQALVESTQTPPQPGGEAIDLGDAIEVVTAASPPPRMPAIVLAADKPPDLQPATVERFPRLAAAQRLLAMSLCAPYVTHTNSGHHIHVEQPQLVVDATRVVVEAVRHDCTALPCDGVPPKADPLGEPLPCDVDGEGSRLPTRPELLPGAQRDNSMERDFRGGEARRES